MTLSLNCATRRSSIFCPYNYRNYPERGVNNERVYTRRGGGGGGGRGRVDEWKIGR